MAVYTYNTITDYKAQQHALELALSKIIFALGDLDDICSSGSPWSVKAQNLIIEINAMRISVLPVVD